MDRALDSLDAARFLQIWQHFDKRGKKSDRESDVSVFIEYLQYIDLNMKPCDE